MDVFDLRNQVVEEYGSYVGSFLEIKDDRIQELVANELSGGFLWPEPLVQLNPAFEQGETLEQLVQEGQLHPECQKIFRMKQEGSGEGLPIRLHRHQVESIRAANAGDNYILTTGTGSGKSLSYIVPAVDHVLRNGSGKGIQAIVVYPMNALANSQIGELEKFLCWGYPQGKPPVTFRRYTGQEKQEERNEIIANPPDILLTNYVMLELVLTRPHEHNLVQAAKGLRFLVLDELHTYRGRQGADVALLVRRVREACKVEGLQHVGTSATLAGGGTWKEQQEEVAQTASTLFGSEVKPERVIGETLRRVTPARDLVSSDFVAELKKSIDQGETPDPGDSKAFLGHPISSWIETTLGLRHEEGTGRLVRCTPTSLTGENGAVDQLSKLSGSPKDKCEKALRKALLAGYQCKDEHGFPVFAFRLHQFFSKGESVYASVEPEDVRFVTLQAQRFKPGDRSRVLLPLVFCRECGQEFYVVRRSTNDQGKIQYIPRELNDNVENDDGEPGFLYINNENPWPSEYANIVERLPDSWLEVSGGKTVVRKARKDRVPTEIFLSTEAIEGDGDIRAHYMRTPFIFCPSCTVAYSAQQKSDFGKLSTLGSEGRSTATTILSLSTIRKLRHEDSLLPEARVRP